MAVGAAWLIVLGLIFLTLAQGQLSGASGAVWGAATLVGVLSALSVGTLLVRRLPHHLVGWLLLAGGLSFALTVGGQGAASDGLPGGVWLAVLSAAAVGPWLGILGGFLLLYLPTGRLPSPRWWPVPLIAAGPTVLLPVAALLSPLAPGTFPAGGDNPLVS